ncbi:hypothetical protein PHJA_001031900 [Phtheirospermum japonicum]|uniref:Uncharacterized protein n=1 Tax=Phtheirospermum japonicum TaxID=374723 RepID=A0A830BS90_9LAMI|nr:hypothetical protein PHJA_001031900 [Phtheirospermum japonicum]
MERDARRKRIASREMDRMALITGRAYAPDPNNISESCSFSNPTNEDRALFQDYPHGGDDVPDTMKMDDTGEKEVAVLSLERRVQSDNANLPYKPFEYHLSSISPKEINFSIISSENTRVVCSFVIAVLVVLSHVNLPHNVVESKSLIAYRPLYALLLTDALIVAARLALYSEGKEDDNEIKFKGGNNNWDGAVKLLEWGLVLHQTVRAVFIDCSCYVAIVVCGLSML